MKQKNYAWAVAFFLLIIASSNIASATNGFTAFAIMDNDTQITRNYGYFTLGESIIRVTGALFSYWAEQDNYIPKGQPSQLYVQYGLQPLADWNSQYPNSTIDYCIMRIKETHQLKTKDGYIPNIVWSLNRTFTTEDIAVAENQFRQFVILYPYEYAEVYADCHFIGENQTIITTLTFKIVAPTWNCKPCQYYQNFKANFDDLIGDAIEININRINDNTKLILGWNIELWMTLFWIIRIIMLFAVISAIFLGLYWVWTFIKTIAKKVTK